MPSVGQRLAEAGAVPSMGSVADPYGNALAEVLVATSLPAATISTELAGQKPVT